MRGSSNASELFVSLCSCTYVEVKRFSDLRDLGKNVRLSVGTGVSMRIGTAKVEFNYVWPLWFQASDK